LKLGNLKILLTQKFAKIQRLEASGLSRIAEIFELFFDNLRKNF